MRKLSNLKTSNTYSMKGLFIKTGHRVNALATSVLILLLCSWPSVSARDLTPIAGLSQVELEDNNTWIFCGREELSQPKGRINVGDAFYIEDIAGRCDYFIYSNDSVNWTGYNVGRTLGMILENPVLLRTYKGRPGYSLVKLYKAKGKLNVKTAIVEDGYSICNVLEVGKVVLAPGDTINNVLLTCTATGSKIKAINSAKIDEKRAEVYRWYANESAIPIAIQKDGILYLDKDANIQQGQENVDTEKMDEQRLIDKAQISLDNGSVIVKLSEPSDLCAFIMDIPGNIYATDSGKKDEFILDTSSLSPNRYIISLTSRNGYERKIMIKL